MKTSFARAFIVAAATLAGSGTMSVGSPRAATLTTIHRFCSQPACTDGAGPEAGLTNVAGTIYGTASDGGIVTSHCPFGAGTVFSLTPAGVETVLYSFRGFPDGDGPRGRLISVGDTLYGITAGGGVSDLGTVFSLTPAGVETVLYSFRGTPAGESPIGGLINVGGTFYGTTAGGGAFDVGTVFSVTTNGVEKLLHSFMDGRDQGIPLAGLINRGSTLYGTTRGPSSRGSVFSVTTQGVEKVLHSFQGGNDGLEPRAGLINVGGTLYGTTVGGGAFSKGTVFSVTPL
jgi:uncharacterized repeat protein (TIGR03803 family)